MSIVPLRGFQEFGSFLLEDQLISNLVQMFNWGLLEKGAFFNNNLNSVLPYGGNPATLRLVNDPNYGSGQVWEGARKDWIWETGVAYSTQPINISGVYVDNIFYPSDASGPFSHYIDYINGRVVFNSPISLSSTVKCEHSIRWVQFEDGRKPWFQSVQYSTFRIDEGHFNQYGSGSYAVLAQNRVQLPAVFIELGRVSTRPAMIGGGKYIDQDVVFSIFGETPWDVGKIKDIFTYQKEQKYSLFNLNLISSLDSFPLDYRNMRVSGAKMYPDFIRESGDGGFYWKSFYVKDFHVGDGIRDGRLSTKTVSWSLEIEAPEI